MDASPLSRLESLPAEILTQIFLLEPNFSLPRASLHLGRVLATDVVYDQLGLRAFAKNDEVVWPDAYYLEALEVCRYCQDLLGREGDEARSRAIKGRDLWRGIDALAVKKLFHEYGDEEIEDWYLEEYRRAGCEEEFGDTDDEGEDGDGEEGGGEMIEAQETEAEYRKRRDKRRVIWRLKMCEEMAGKRYLQQEMVKSKWFKLKHVQKVESCCLKCPYEHTSTFGLDVCCQLGFFPCKVETMFAYFRRFHHRRHVLHGTELPTRLLNRSFEGREDDKDLLAKLIGWTDDDNWAATACSLVRQPVLTAAAEGMKDAIRKGRLADVEFFGNGYQPSPSIGVEPTMEMIKIALVENRPSATNDQILLYLLEQYERRKKPKWWKDPSWLPCFKAAKQMRTVDKTKERGKWLVFHLKEQTAPVDENSPGSSYIYRLRRHAGTLDPNMPLKLMMEVIDNDLGVEQIWGAVTRKERRKFEGDAAVNNAFILKTMKIAHMFSQDGGQNIGDVTRFEAAKLWGLSPEKLKEMGAVIPRS